MADVRLSAAMRKEAASKVQLAKTTQAFAKDRWKRAHDAETKKMALLELNNITSGVRRAGAEMKAAEMRLKMAQDREERALQSKKDAEKKMTSMRWKLGAQYSRGQVQTAVLRVRQAMDQMRVVAQAPEAPAVVEEVVEVEEGEEEVPESEFEQLPPKELVASFSKSIGPQENWVVGMRAEDVTHALKVCAWQSVQCLRLRAVPSPPCATPSARTHRSPRASHGRLLSRRNSNRARTPCNTGTGTPLTSVLECSGV